jgi:hypothetical protein
MAIKGMGGIVLAALGVCVFAVTLALLLAAVLSSAAFLEWLTFIEWLTTTPPCGGPAS